jgi:hydrogenase maturation protease
MNLARVEKIAKAVLYEGYMLYPYRPSSVKNQQRWNFGVVFPQAYRESLEGAEICSMRIECLVKGTSATIVEGRLRFLHLQAKLHSHGAAGGFLPDGWQEAVERDIAMLGGTLGDLCERRITQAFAFAAHTQVESENISGIEAVERRQEAVEGTVEISAEKLNGDLFKVVVVVQNTTSFLEQLSGRDAVLMHSMVSTHAVLGIKGGEFLSLLEPPEGLRELADSCRNIGVWPVLVGDPGDRDTILASPIILYDYPQIAPESSGDLFDGTEIDEILSLRILTLTDEEKREIRQSDERARQILERTEEMPAEQFMKLHGAVRGMRPLKEDRP